MISLLVMPSLNKGINAVSLVFLVLHLRYTGVKNSFKPRHGASIQFLSTQKVGGFWCYHSFQPWRNCSKRQRRPPTQTRERYCASGALSPVLKWWWGRLSAEFWHYLAFMALTWLESRLLRDTGGCWCQLWEEEDPKSLWRCWFSLVEVFWDTKYWELQSNARD